jgi:hypothetical protein
MGRTGVYPYSPGGYLYRSEGYRPGQDAERRAVWEADVGVLDDIGLSMDPSVVLGVIGNRHVTAELLAVMWVRVGRYSHLAHLRVVVERDPRFRRYMVAMVQLAGC